MKKTGETMKKSFVTLLAIVSLFVLAGCGESPKSVAQKWQKAVLSGDLKTANAMSTARAKDVNTLIVAMLSEGGDEINTLKKAKYDTETINGDKAVVTSGNDKDTKVELVKQDGKWLVDINKDIN